MYIVYKCRSGLVPQYLAEHFSNISDKHEYYTRTNSCKNLNLVKPKNHQDDQLKQSFKYSGAVNGNDLNPVIRNATNLKAILSWAILV